MVERFGRTERALHWVHATGFFAMLATGLVLYLPALSELVARRNLVKNLHIFSALAWAIAIVLVVALGDRRRLAADWREIETLDHDDRRWLRGRPAAQGRFNAGQKVNAILTDEGFQTQHRDRSKRVYYEPTAKSEASGAVMQDTGKKKGDGTPIRQLRWASRIVDVLRSLIGLA